MISRYDWLIKGIFLWVAAIALTSCGFFDDLSQSPSSVARGSDSAPSTKLHAKHIKDAVPRVESKSRGGNFSPYTVLGKTYTVLDDSANYKERGDASWYGTKFHGRLTANGERYNMYAMSAAHKSLPIPTYVKVTNLENRRHIIVRVNDRGPFHPGRIIDLSYAGASKLGILKKGTARVEVEAIDPRQWKKNTKNRLQISANEQQGLASVQPATTNEPQSTHDLGTNDSPSVRPPTSLTVAPAALPRYYLQIAAFSKLNAAQDLQNRLLDQLASISRSVNVIIRPSELGLYRVRIGPFSTEEESLAFKKIPELQSLGKIHRVSE
tara:strand:- start:2953 stop:3924 length:972 start_codon:yes stop_codon:yes gene_type:complete